MFTRQIFEDPSILVLFFFKGAIYDSHRRTFFPCASGTRQKLDVDLLSVQINVYFFKFDKDIGNIK